MRLVDADALREHWHISEKCEECHWNNRDCSKPPYYSLHDICEAIDEVPTIDAIPVEWLEEHDGENIRDTDGNIYGRRHTTISKALSMWHEEQEGRDSAV